MKINAAVFRVPEHPLTIEEIDIDEPASREVLVRTVASGVCHSDLHYVHGLIPLPAPAILGHEPAGVVEAIGRDVTSVKAGDHVVACTSIFCGHCTRCLSGQPYLCTNRSQAQRAGKERPRLSQKGAPLHQFVDLASYAEKMLLHENAVVKIADDIPLDRAALVGCGVTTGVGAALNTAKVAPGSSTAIFGAGGVGLSVIQGCRLAGARQIIAVDLLDNKLDLARHFGATDTVNAKAVDPVKEIKRLSSGGVDYSFEAIGNKQAAEQSFYCLAPAGVATIVGVIPWGQKLEIDPRHFLVEKKIQGSIMGSNRFRVDMPRYLDFYRQGRLNLDDMVSRHGRLEDVNEAFRAMEAGEVARTVLMFD